MKKHIRILNKLFTNQTKRTQYITAALVVIAVAGIGTYLLTPSHAATPYASINAGTGTLASGATKQTCSGSSDGSCVVFGSAPGSGAAPGCTSNGVVAPCVGNTTSAAGGWGTPVFDDEFTKDSSLNTTTWSPDWYGNGNNQNGTNMYSSNVSVTNGYLNLEASGAAGASGGIISSDPDDGQPGHTGYQYTYGFVEARIYLPASGTEVANWPAFWAVGQNWPVDGEMDVMEGLGGSACYHFHYGTSPSDKNGPGNCVSGNYTGWHTFGANWQPGVVTYYYDGVDVGQITTGITTEPMFLILENSTGTYGLLPVTTPSDMLVSYVRVWQ